jgi:hypothetical protein
MRSDLAGGKGKIFARECMLLRRVRTLEWRHTFARKALNADLMNGFDLKKKIGEIVFFHILLQCLWIEDRHGEDAGKKYTVSSFPPNNPLCFDGSPRI